MSNARNLANLLGTGTTVADAKIAGLTASKLTGALPAISGANLTGLTDQGSLVKVAGSQSTSNVTNVTFDNVVVATYDDYLLLGSVVGTDGANFSVDIYYRANDGSADYDVSTGANGLAHYQGQWSNRAAGSAYQGNVLNGSNAYLRLPISQDVYGGGIMTFAVHFHNLHGGQTVGTTNISTRTIRNGNYQWSAQTTNASDAHGGNGWFRADNPNKNLVVGTRPIHGLKINSGNNNFVKHNITLYGYVK